jgi:hypothetical protein
MSNATASKRNLHAQIRGIGSDTPARLAILSWQRSQFCYQYLGRLLCYLYTLNQEFETK